MQQITVFVPDPAGILDSSAFGAGALLRWENGAAIGGPFTEQGTRAITIGTSAYIFWDPTGTPATWYRTRYSDAGGALFSDYSAPFGPQPDAYCTVLDVKQRMSGGVPVQSGAFDEVLNDAIIEVSDLINGEVRNIRGQGEGWSFLPKLPTTSRYTGRQGGSSLLLIDDSVAVSAVAILDPVGVVTQTLIPGTDYLTQPMNSLPITGIILTRGWWPWYPGGVQVTRTPGYGLTTPYNVRGVAIQEVIRSYRGGQAGEDDRLGMSPFGSVIVSKALLQSSMRMLNRYRLGSGMLRGPS